MGQHSRSHKGEPGRRTLVVLHTLAVLHRSAAPQSPGLHNRRAEPLLRCNCNRALGPKRRPLKAPKPLLQERELSSSLISLAVGCGKFTSGPSTSTRGDGSLAIYLWSENLPCGFLAGCAPRNDIR